MKTPNLKQQLFNIIKKQDSFSYYYEWLTKKIVPIDSTTFFDLVYMHKTDGLIKRCQCYSNQTIQISKRKYYLYMISFGDFKYKKAFYGQNPLAKALGRCMFDNVYIFVQECLIAQKKIVSKIQKMLTQNRKWNALIMFQSLKLLFPNSTSITQILTLLTPKTTQQLTINSKNDELQAQKMQTHLNSQQQRMDLVKQ